MRVFTCLFTEHNLWLVLLAAAMCATGSVVTMHLYRRGLSTRGAEKSGWLFLTAVCAGSSIWATHFIAMLGFQPGVPVTFDATLTLVSMILAIAGTGAGLALSGMRFSRHAPAIGGCVFGLAIAAMHFTGMFAYRVDGLVDWDQAYVTASIGLAAGLAGMAFWAVERWKNGPAVFIAPGILVVAIVALHFTGMAAFVVTPIAGMEVGADSAAFRAMALSVAVAGMVIIGTGVTSYLIDHRTREESDEQLRHMALHDPLTGLANRTSFNTYLDARLASPDADGVAVVGIDLNRFKEINDVWGHEAGDAVLCALAERLKGLAGQTHFAARLGGDEFCVVLNAENRIALQERVDTIEQMFATPVSYGEYESATGASIGVAVFPHDGADRDSLVRNADLAMYKAKMDPMLDVCFYDTELGDEVRERRAMANDLRHAIENDQLHVHYQVQTSIGTGEIRGYEALLRWTHPRLGAIGPDTFIPLAEANGLILPLGEWVMRQACRDAASWDNDHKVAVNLSAVQLTHSGLARQIQQILLETGLPVKRLEIELTETALIKDKVQSMHIMRQIKALGVSVALDDFGTGYSSLDILRTFPFDKIKLDKSFTGELESDHRSLAVVRAILALAKSLGIPVLAEGIETMTQLDLLRDEACDEGQGFFLGRPAPMDILAETPASDIVLADAVPKSSTA
ncbi:diguanylate cyclase [Maricaulis sp. W15]|uniref:putative bifunctional diguanylate cyclase/phosphodiesterase n=1 Tax=Maricaulis sp. W15 TaxID=1772333 RepID=UPI000948DEF5|nr:bifunctional diguanylate cyclase/phosphodiesterase [Maricaulis sp. W15]OLF77745.1 diguanylate cyclase [Maricaulis sp. W15]